MHTLTFIDHKSSPEQVLNKVNFRSHRCYLTMQNYKVNRKQFIFNLRQQFRYKQCEIPAKNKLEPEIQSFLNFIDFHPTNAILL